MYIDFPFHKLFIYMVNRKWNCIPAVPLSMVFVTTLKCNSRCKTCFIWRNKKSKNSELTLEEYKKIFQSLGKIYWVTVGGGEPFLRKDFIEIVINICKYLRPKIINIPTNGSMPDEIFKVMSQLVATYPNTKFILNLSVDHIGEKHDWIRGMEGNFHLLSQTIERLKTIKRSNFMLGIHTVISKFNSNEFQYIYYWINKNFQPDFYIIENAQIREEFMNEEVDLLREPEDYVKAIDFFLGKIKSARMYGFQKLKRAMRITYYNSVKKSLILNTRPYTCYAGHASCQVNLDGEVWACATKGYVMGNLRNYDYNFKTLWSSVQANNVRQEIKKNECSCYLSNAAYTNILLNPGKLFQVFKNLLVY